MSNFARGKGLKDETMSTIERDDVKDYHNNLVINLDNDIAIVRDIKDMPLDDGEFRVDAFVLMFCHQGKAEFDVNTKSYQLRANEVFVMRPHDVVNNLMFSHNFSGSAMGLSEETVKNMIGENGMWKAFFYFADAPIISVQEKRMSILQEYGRLFKQRIEMGQTPLRKEIITSIIGSMLLEICEDIKEDKTLTTNVNVHSKDLLFRMFIDLISGSKRKPRIISWYSDQLNITPKYLSTICKQASGKTAFEWISHYVAIDIRNLLKNTNKPIKEIVHILDFPNISFFGSYCRRHFGMSPLEYRAYLRSQDFEPSNTNDHADNNC